VTNSTDWWQRPARKPPRLRRGDRVAVVTPCWGGPAAFPKRYEAGKVELTHRFGLKVVETPHALRGPEWLQANPAARADDLMGAFADPSVKAIIASIGGDDAVRLIPHLDLAVIRDNPKLFIGYSDPTVIHFACLKAGVVSLHGPTIMSGFAENGGMSPLTALSFQRAAFEVQPPGELPPNKEGWTTEHLSWEEPENQPKPRRRTATDGIEVLRGSGEVTGHLIGGCAEVLEMLKGTPLWPPLSYWDGAILFYETSEEAPSEALVLRWLRNYAAQGILERLHGIVLGRPGGQMDDAQRHAQKRAVLAALDEAGLINFPVLAEVDIGHTDPIATLPYATNARIDCTNGRLFLLEAAVSD
jgi:muramoyltetrapeptide carboxypeptidase LdcA involved in peptidoglycan recycling